MGYNARGCYISEVWVNGKPIPFPRQSPNSRADRDGRPPVYIVLHSTGGGFLGAIDWFLRKISGVSAHFVISRKGEYRQMVSIHRIAYHAGRSRWEGRADMNSCSLGIEHEHIDGRWKTWPDAQIKASQALCVSLCLKLGIDPKNIITHAQIAWPRGRKVDPMGFPLELLRYHVKRKLREYGMGR